MVAQVRVTAVPASVGTRSDQSINVNGLVIRSAFAPHEKLGPGFLKSGTITIEIQSDIEHVDITIFQHRPIDPALVLRHEHTPPPGALIISGDPDAAFQQVQFLPESMLKGRRIERQPDAPQLDQLFVLNSAVRMSDIKDLSTNVCIRFTSFFPKPDGTEPGRRV